MMTHARTHAAGWFAVLALALPESLSALTCNPVGDWPDVDGERIGVYIESDFAQEMRDATPNTVDDATTELQIRNLIMQVAETWNLGTRSRTLHYAGFGDWEDNADFCADRDAGPYDSLLYVHFEEADTGGGAAGRVKWIDQTDSACDNKRELIIYKLNGNGNARDWRFGSNAGGQLLTTVLVHEFGHVVGLGHAEQLQPAVLASRRSEQLHLLHGNRLPGGRGLRVLLGQLVQLHCGLAGQGGLRRLDLVCIRRGVQRRSLLDPACSSHGERVHRRATSTRILRRGVPPCVDRSARPVHLRPREPGVWTQELFSTATRAFGGPTFLADGDGVEAALLWAQVHN